MVIFLLVWFMAGDKEYNWSESYKYNKQEPYDNTLLFELMKARAVEDSFFLIQKSLALEFKPSSITGTASYVYVGSNSFYSYNDIDSLLLFVGNGHDAFLSVNYLDLDLAHHLNIMQCTIPLDTVVYEQEEYDSVYIDEDWGDWEDLDFEPRTLTSIEYDFLDSIVFAYPDTSADLDLLHPTLALKEPLTITYQPRHITTEYNWSYFNFENWCGGDTAITKLGTISCYSYNFIRVPYGKGYFYIHLTPLAFTNYYLREDAKLAYAQNVFSHLPDGAIYWDEGSHYYKVLDRSDSSNNSNPFEKSDLYYILSQPASKWAFYTLLVGILLYIIFYMKRRQRIIPVVEPYTNTSIEYVQTIGGLYFMKNDHRKLADQQFKLFLSYLRTRYRITTHNIDDALIKKVAEISKVDQDQVQRLFVSYENIASKRTMSEQQLISFNNYLEYFYKNCK